MTSKNDRDQSNRHAGLSFETGGTGAYDNHLGDGGSGGNGNLLVTGVVSMDSSDLTLEGGAGNLSEAGKRRKWGQCEPFQRKSINNIFLPLRCQLPLYIWRYGGGE